jgi:hypothetical protein
VTVPWNAAHELSTFNRSGPCTPSSEFRSQEWPVALCGSVATCVIGGELPCPLPHPDKAATRQTAAMEPSTGRDPPTDRIVTAGHGSHMSKGSRQAKSRDPNLPVRPPGRLPMAAAASEGEVDACVLCCE